MDRKPRTGFLYPHLLSACCHSISDPGRLLPPHRCLVWLFQRQTNDFVQWPNTCTAHALVNRKNAQTQVNTVYMGSNVAFAHGVQRLWGVLSILADCASWQCDYWRIRIWTTHSNLPWISCCYLSMSSVVAMLGFYTFISSSEGFVWDLTVWHNSLEI